MLGQRRARVASIFVLIIIGSIGFLHLQQNDRYKAFHSVDIVQLLATGMCYGVALAGIFEMVRKRRED